MWKSGQGAAVARRGDTGSVLTHIVEPAILAVRDVPFVNVEVGGCEVVVQLLRGNEFSARNGANIGRTSELSERRTISTLPCERVHELSGDRSDQH